MTIRRITEGIITTKIIVNQRAITADLFAQTSPWCMVVQKKPKDSKMTGKMIKNARPMKGSKIIAAPPASLPASTVYCSNKIKMDRMDR